jgi:hypothetical protein
MLRAGLGSKAKAVEWIGMAMVAVMPLLLSLTATAQAPAPGLDAFHWVDFHNEKDAPTVAWVTQALKAEHWTAMREIGVNGDSAVVVTTERKDPQATPDSDGFTIWSVSLAKHDVQPLLRGVNLRLLNWTNFGGAYQRAPELAIVYNDCTGCDAPSLFFTTIYYNLNDHAWRGRWMRGDQAVALTTAAHVEGVKQTQVYGLLTELPGRDILATWSHLDFGGAKPAQDYFFEYGVDPSTGLEQTQALGPDHAEKMKARLCQANPGQKDPALAVLAGGQDSELCRGTPAPAPGKRRGERARRPTTTPPANNHGQSTPGGGKPKTQ